MYFDLNVTIPALSASQTSGLSTSKKGKGKQQQQQPQQQPPPAFTPGQINAIEARVDLLVHLGYTVLAFNQIALKRVDAKTHVNVLDGLLAALRPRPGILFLKRLTIVLDEDSEKGFGLTNANASIFAPYDLLALQPTTATTLSLACLTHTLPSPLTAHILALPLTAPRLPFHLKHTLVRAALRNGAVFEIPYAGMFGEAPPPDTEQGATARLNWWAGAREVVRVTKGKGVIVTGGVSAPAHLRGARDVGNLATLLGMAQDAANDASTTTCKSLVLRAQTRRTYRAVLSEPVIVFPDASFSIPSKSPDEVRPVPGPNDPAPSPSPQHQEVSLPPTVAPKPTPITSTAQSQSDPADVRAMAAATSDNGSNGTAQGSQRGNTRKRPLDDEASLGGTSEKAQASPAGSGRRGIGSASATRSPGDEGGARKKKRKKGKADGGSV